MLLIRILLISSEIIRQICFPQIIDKHDCVTSAGELLLNIKALGNGVRLFIDETDDRDAINPHIEYLSRILFKALTDVLQCKTGFVSTLSFLTGIYTMYIDWAWLFPEDWVQKFKTLTEVASGRFGSRLRDGLNWFGPSTNKNWADRLLWLEAVCEQLIDRQLTKYCSKEEFDMLAEQVAYLQFYIIPQQMLAILRRAYEIFKTGNGDLSMLDSSLTVLQHILNITRIFLKLGLSRSGAKTNPIWAGKHFTENFQMRMPFFHKLCGFELGNDYSNLEYRPLKHIKDSYSEFFNFVGHNLSQLLTFRERVNVREDMKYFLACLSGQPSVEGPFPSLSDCQYLQLNNRNSNTILIASLIQLQKVEPILLRLFPLIFLW